MSQSAHSHFDEGDQDGLLMVHQRYVIFRNLQIPPSPRAWPAVHPVADTSSRTQTLPQSSELSLPVCPRSKLLHQVDAAQATYLLHYQSDFHMYQISSWQSLHHVSDFCATI